MPSTTSRVVTLAQLALLPIGTLIACVKFGEYGQVEHDCQGIVQVGPVHYISKITESWVDITPLLPDLHWHEGNVVESYMPTAICRTNFVDHRFIVYSEEVLKKARQGGHWGTRTPQRVTK